MKRAIAVSSGDPSGIGPETIIKAWLMRKDAQLPVFFVIGDDEIFRRTAERMKVNIDFSAADADFSFNTFDDALPILALKNSQVDRVGTSDPKNASGIIEAIERGTMLVCQGHASALVTCPIAKKPLYDAGFCFPGHTEFLADLAQKFYGERFKPVMMLAGPHLRTVPVTVHVPLSKVFKMLSTDLIIETGRIVAHDLEHKFKLKNPKIVVSGLNPHAGENGALGDEDIDLIKPAVLALKNEGIAINGPFASDTLFNSEKRATYDAALCMYHDQALIPVKTIGFDDTVNVTLGLPFIRTSPDHGTAFDIAGKNIASPASLISAIKLAQQLAN